MDEFFPWFSLIMSNTNWHQTSGYHLGTLLKTFFKKKQNPKMHTQPPLPQTKPTPPKPQPSNFGALVLKSLKCLRKKNQFVTYWWIIFPPFTLMVTYELYFLSDLTSRFLFFSFDFFTMLNYNTWNLFLGQKLFVFILGDLEQWFACGTQLKYCSWKLHSDSVLSDVMVVMIEILHWFSQW